MNNYSSANSLLNEAPCAFFIMNESGTILHQNKTFKAWLGIEEGDSLPQNTHLYDLLSIGSKIYCETHFFPMLQMHGSVKEINLEIIQKKGKKIPVLVNTVSCMNDKDELEYHSVVIDITHRKLYEKELLLSRKKSEQLVKELDQKNKELANFAHTVAHDLKTPLRNMLGLISLAEASANPQSLPDQSEYLAKASERGQYLTTFIDALLNFASSGENQLQYAPVDLSDIFTEIESNLTHLFSETDASLTISNSKGKVLGNKMELVRLFQNLIENALKYRKMFLPLKAEVNVSKSGNFILIQVVDNGIGIPSEYLSSIFNPFTRAHSTSIAKGTGIGLATCKKIVLAHKGEIWVESTQYEGSAFFVKLPLLDA